ncbi:unnamed protein product [Somion occarium]|uniref:S-adenosyl-L-methionine-dependent methyltransferase n=1 Tax=Somion occarium TaxID=3059160 RepID=A0ABP1DXN8_9APHY
MDTSFTELDQLVSLISTSVADLKAEYHPPKGLQQAVLVIQGACAQLSALVAPPQHTITIRGMDFLTSACLNVAVNAKVADHLLDNIDGLHVSKLAALTGIGQVNLSRVLRLLATKHIFREVSHNVFANNRLSITLLSYSPMSSLTGLCTDEILHSSTALYETITDPDPDNNLTAWSRSMKYPGPVWEWYQKVDPARAKRFGSAMTGFSSVVTFESTLYGFPWKTQPLGTKVCDLGGGVGHVSMHLAKACPQLHIVLQDLPHTIEQAKPLWQENASDIFCGQRVEFVPIDFLKGSPVSGCDFYFMKNVIHNWSDGDTNIIFSNIKQAMKSTSRLLIQEFVIQHVSREAAPGKPDSNDTSKVDLPNLLHGFISCPSPQAPEPLLPNYGEGRILPYYLDIAMMSFINSKERTLDEYRELGKYSGFELVKVWDCGETDIIEYKPVD